MIWNGGIEENVKKKHGKYKINYVLNFLFNYSAKWANTFAPFDITSICELIEIEPNPIIKSDEFPLELTLPAGSYEILFACKDEDRINVICNSTYTNFLLVVTANKFKDVWTQVEATYILLPIYREGNKIIEFHCPDINTLFVGYELSDGEKRAFLMRITIDGVVLYTPENDPYSEQSVFEKSYLELQRRDLHRHLRTKY